MKTQEAALTGHAFEMGSMLRAEARVDFTKRPQEGLNLERFVLPPPLARRRSISLIREKPDK